MGDDLIFEEPPVTATGPHSQGNSPVGLWLAALRDHPGRWAKFPDTVPLGLSSRIKKGDRYGAKAGEFEVRMSYIGAPPPRVWLYARYVGGQS